MAPNLHPHAPWHSDSWERNLGHGRLSAPPKPGSMSATKDIARDREADLVREINRAGLLLQQAGMHDPGARSRLDEPQVIEIRPL